MIQILSKRKSQRERSSMAERLDIMPIEQADGRGYSPAVQAYFAHYGLDGELFGTEHLFGTFPSGDFTLAGHLFRPAEYTATVFLVHGYLNHSGQFRHLIRFLLDNGVAVGVFDLPGHGLSTGDEAAIDTMTQYTQAVQDFVAAAGRWVRPPYAVVGFSLGGAIVMDLLRQGCAAFERVVLAAPLVHWSLYEQSKGTYKVYSAFTDRIARFHQKNSSDREYLVFNKTQDTLHRQWLSLRWVKAMFDWNAAFAAMPSCLVPIRVIQGDKDTTIDWRYNLNAVREKFPNAEIQMIHGARHELFNEAPGYRQAAFDCMKQYFDIT